MYQVLQEILNERQRQIGHGFDATHDDRHTDGSLAFFAEMILSDLTVADVNRWTAASADKVEAKHDVRGRLIIAAAILVAEIERLDRAALAVIAGHAEPVTHDMQQLVDSSSAAALLTEFAEDVGSL